MTKQELLEINQELKDLLQSVRDQIDDKLAELQEPDNEDDDDDDEDEDGDGDEAEELVAEDLDG